jgi:hypothetical protein
MIALVGYLRDDDIELIDFVGFRKEGWVAGVSDGS